jgi:acyl-CoA thioesterase
VSDSAAPNASAHPFDEATRLEATEDGTLRGHTSEAYWNFTGPFGGTTAATLMRAVTEHARRIGDPLSITVNFCAPTAKGAFDVTVREIKTNRSTQHWYVELSQAEVGVAANATIACAVRRPTWAHQPAKPPHIDPPESLTPLPMRGGMAWLQRYKFRFAKGTPMRLAAMPSDEPASARTALWVSDAPARPLDFLSLTALSDTFFGRIFHVRGAMLRIGTVSMTTYFHADAAGLAAAGSGPLLGTADATTFSKGFFDQKAELWSRTGALLATSTQIVYFRD